jgi:hypothetical protein
VKYYEGGKHGATYPDMPWEPKESFRAVADYYAKHGEKESVGRFAPQRRDCRRFGVSLEHELKRRGFEQYTWWGLRDSNGS